MRRDAIVLVLGGAVYGASVGAEHGLELALQNLVKLPLLLCTTAAVCSLAYYLTARLFGLRIGFGEVMELVIRCFRDLALLLASLGPACLFFALVFAPPVSPAERGEYPRFVGFNVLLIAACGTLAVIRQARTILHRHSISARRSAAIVGAWLALSLVVGAQGAWYLRPFFGRRYIPITSFCRGTEVDEDGAGSFYTAVYRLVSLPASSQRHGLRVGGNTPAR